MEGKSGKDGKTKSKYIPDHIVNATFTTYLYVEGTKVLGHSRRMCIGTIRSPKNVIWDEIEGWFNREMDKLSEIMLKMAQAEWKLEESHTKDCFPQWLIGCGATSILQMFDPVEDTVPELPEEFKRGCYLLVVLEDLETILVERSLAALMAFQFGAIQRRRNSMEVPPKADKKKPKAVSATERPSCALPN